MDLIVDDKGSGMNKLNIVTYTFILHPNVKNFKSAPRNFKDAYIVFTVASYR